MKPNKQPQPRNPKKDGRAIQSQVPDRGGTSLAAADHVPQSPWRSGAPPLGSSSVDQGLSSALGAAGSLSIKGAGGR
ncbi:hypothetical protein P7K49_009562 [Saguinus oedipus]|uniref:Uncharacterized protein n=1 Tax=Saguinus oedipus TaxID=9490 RepID=A0ABQ9VKA6_SAGOE|nr:hypothetical protein P7K49_009562 [Saguinus oedipus]